MDATVSKAHAVNGIRRFSRKLTFAEECRRRPAFVLAVSAKADFGEGGLGAGQLRR